MRPPPAMGRLEGGIALILCSGTKPPPEGLEGDNDGVDELELDPGDWELLLWLLLLPLPEPGLLERSQALYCSLDRPDPGRASLENAVLDSWAAMAKGSRLLF